MSADSSLFLIGAPSGAGLRSLASCSRSSATRAVISSRLVVHTSLTPLTACHIWSGGTYVPPWMISPSGVRKTVRSEEHTSELQSLAYLVCRLLLEKKKIKNITTQNPRK